MNVPGLKPFVEVQHLRTPGSVEAFIGQIGSGSALMARGKLCLARIDSLKTRQRMRIAYVVVDVRNPLKIGTFFGNANHSIQQEIVMRGTTVQGILCNCSARQ